MTKDIPVYPLTTWQDYVLKREQHPDAVERFLSHLTLHFALRIKPGIGDRRLNRAFKALCQRHDITRTRFRTEGAGACMINPEHATGVTYHDYSDAPEDRIESLAVTHAQVPIRMDDPALAQLDVLKFGARGDVVVCRVHHVIADGFGFMLLVEDLIKMVIGIPLLPGAVSYAKYYYDYGRDKPSDAAAHDLFWQDKLLPPASPLAMGRVAKGLPLMRDGVTWKTAKNCVARLSKSQIGHLETQARAAGVTMFMLINAAFLEALGELGASDDFFYTMTLGRSDSELSTYAGHHTLSPLMRHRRRPNASLAKAAQDASNDFVATLRHLPSTAARRDGVWDDRVYSAGGYPRQIATGFDVPTGRIQASPFAKTFTLSAGTTFRVGIFELQKLKMPPNPGDIDEIGFRPNFGPDGGEFSFNFDSEAYSDREIEDIVDATLSRLGEKPASTYWTT